MTSGHATREHAARVWYHPAEQLRRVVSSTLGASGPAISKVVHRNSPQHHATQNFYEQFSAVECRDARQRRDSRLSNLVQRVTGLARRVCGTVTCARARVSMHRKSRASRRFASGWHSLCNLPPRDEPRHTCPVRDWKVRLRSGDDDARDRTQGLADRIAIL